MYSAFNNNNGTGLISQNNTFGLSEDRFNTTTVKPLNSDNFISTETLNNFTSILEASLNKPLLRNDVPESTVDQTFQGMYFPEVLANIAAKDGSSKLKTWVKEGLDPNMENVRGRTLFTSLAMNPMGLDSLELIRRLEVLLDTGKVQLYKKDNDGYNTFDYLREMGNPSTKELILWLELHKDKSA